MLSRLLFAFLFLTVASVIYAQEAVVAKRFFDRGRERLDRKDYDGAISDFSRALELISPTARNQKVRRKDWTNRMTSRDDIGGSERVRLLDPNTANVYANRCLARYEKGDLNGAIADCSQAVFYSP